MEAWTHCGADALVRKFSLSLTSGLLINQEEKSFTKVSLAEQSGCPFPL